MKRRPIWLKRIGIWILAPGLALFLFADEITRRVIESGVEDALGTDVSVSLVRLGLIGGGVQLYGLSVPNPAGFQEADLLTIGHASIGLRIRELLAERVVVPRLEVEDVRVDLERRGDHTNYGPVLSRLERSTGSAHAEHDQDSTFTIQEIRVTDIQADVRMLPELGAVPDAQDLTGLENIKVKIPEIVLRDVSAQGDLTELVARLTDLIAAAVLESVAQHATGLPVAMVDELASVSGSLGSTSLHIVGEVTQIGGEAVGSTLEATLGAAAGNTARAVTQTADDAIESVAGFVEHETH